MALLSYRRHRFPPPIIQHTIWLYLRFTLSYRDVEDLLAERGLDVSYETVRRWVLQFGATIADHAKAAKVKNIYAELGSLARMMRTDPARYSVLIGNLLDGFGADHILWGTDTP